MILDKIVETKKEEVAALKKVTSVVALEEMIARLDPCRDFRKAISGGSCNIIAEVKCASPSRGRLVEHFEPVAIAKTYDKNGAAAISVLTDEKYFLGHKDYLTQVKREVRIPVLRKDFIIDPLQIYETRVIGADAVLLIVRVVGQKLKEFITLAKNLGLFALVEVHTQEELKIALAADADIVGINNRNLDTFVTDIKTSVDLKKLIPAEKIVVAESGIHTREDRNLLMKTGISCFLIGESLISAPDIAKKMRELNGDEE